MMFSIAATILLAAQGTAWVPGAEVVADNEETWVLEYPVLIAPQVDEYRNCLRSGMKVAGKGLTFEPQHREDIDRCAKLARASEDSSNAILRERKWVKYAPPEQVAAIFATIGAVHVSRGRDLDTRISKSLARSAEQYSADMHPDYGASEQASESVAP